MKRKREAKNGYKPKTLKQIIREVRARKVTTPEDAERQAQSAMAARAAFDRFFRQLPPEDTTSPDPDWEE